MRRKKKSLYLVFQSVAKYNIRMIQDLYHELQTGDFCYLHMGSTIMSAISICRHLCVCVVCVCVCVCERERESTQKHQGTGGASCEATRYLKDTSLSSLNYICLASSRCFLYWPSLLPRQGYFVLDSLYRV